MSEEQIIENVRQWFGQIAEPSPQLLQYSHQMGRLLPFDGVCSLAEKTFYIEIKQNTDLRLDVQQTLMQELSEFVRIRQIEPAPLIIVTQKNNECYFGFLIYWDYDKCYLNNNINWRKFNQDSIDWLKLQLKAHRQRIAFLPDSNIRVIKTISLNSPDFVEAEIIYLRKFCPATSYIMHTPPVLTDQERFHRLLKGTPQSEYPNDDLDKWILSTVRTIFQDATPKSDLLLFDVDLIKYRHIKDKRKNTFSIKIIPTIFNEEGRVIGYRNERYDDINLELYYYPNVFKPDRARPILNEAKISVSSIPQVQQLLTTLDSLSSINI